MVKLEHISVDNNAVVCDIFVEDCKIPVKASVNKNGEFVCDNLPAGYEWCRVHLGYVKRALKELLDSGDLKDHMTITWG